jgi:hypothetical protein
MGRYSLINPISASALPVAGNILQSGIRRSKIIKLAALGCLMGLTIRDIGRWFG